MLDRIGRAAVLLVLAEEGDAQRMLARAGRNGYRAVLGRVGSMDVDKIVAAIETAAKREGLIEHNYREEHALYHAALEAFHGVGRGQMALGSILRTVGLNFAIVRGPRGQEQQADGEWIAVALYGTIGAPVRGFEHETVGLGINHL
ncbi:hypothetical protein SY88_21770 [Clostridiales bacterium PH28_bin88]|nr:hypothetical protein SY88_21770 [Clostridiales bacterium PH28_bin88]